MSQSTPDRQFQEQENLIKDTNVRGDLTFAPVQNIIETQIIQSSIEAVTQRKLNKNSPYQGLKRFNFKDRDRFFGRKNLWSIKYFMTSFLRRIKTHLTPYIGAY